MLPAMSYRYAVFAVPNMTAAGEFFSQYTGAYELKDDTLLDLGDDDDEEVVGYRLPMGTDIASPYSDGNLLLL
jgi:hypothetical protein